MSEIKLHKIFRSIVPNVLYEDPQYQELLYLLSIIFDDVKDLIDRFPELADVDNVEEVFLPKLAKLVGYKLRYSIDLDVQREIIKNMIHVYRDRGSDDSISMAATYGDDPNWIGGHLFTPGHYDNKVRAWVEHPVEQIFRFDISEFSGEDKLQDKTYYRAGTIIIHSATWNDELRKAVRKVVPAGLRIYYMIDAEAGSIVTDFGEWFIPYSEYSIHYEMYVDRLLDESLEFSIYDKNFSGSHMFSGSAELTEDYKVSIDTASSMYPLSHLSESDLVAHPDREQINHLLSHGLQDLEFTKAYLTSDFPIIFSDVERPQSSIYPMSGGWLGEFMPSHIINIYECLPNDIAYKVGSIHDHYPPGINMFDRVLTEYDISKDTIVNVIMGASLFQMSALTLDDYKSNISSGTELNNIVNHDIQSSKSTLDINSVRYTDSAKFSDLSLAFSDQYVLSGLSDEVSLSSEDDA